MLTVAEKRRIGDSSKAISLIEQGYTKTEIAKILGVSRPTLNRILSDAVA